MTTTHKYATNMLHVSAQKYSKIRKLRSYKENKVDKLLYVTTCL
jgi:hypothetical protein